jgi:hypothetical protein
MNKYDPRVLRAALWTWRAARRVKKDLSRSRLDDVRVIPVPSLPAEAGRGVAAVLRRTSYTCLERALLLQAWNNAHGLRRDVIIGVTRPSEGFKAHAWLDGESPCHEEGFTELTRRAPA